MTTYLLVQSFVGVGVLALLWAMKDTPPRLRFAIALAGVLVWALPVPLLQAPTSIPNHEAIYTLLVLQGETQSVADDALIAATSEPWRGPSMMMVLMALFGVGLALWCRSLWRHHRERLQLQKTSRDANHVWAQVGMEPVADLRFKPGAGAKTSGLLKPVIWVGEAHEHDRDLRAIIAHEATHLRHRDNLSLFVLHFWECLFWWNPLVRFLGQKTRFYMELACDERCKREIGLGDYQRALAGVILHTAGLVGGRRPDLAAALIGHRRENMRRLKLMSNDYGLRWRHGFAALVFMTFALALIAKPAMTPVQEPQVLYESDGVARVGEAGVEPPVFTKRIAPKYPDRAKKIKLQGYVILEAILGKDGLVRDIKVLRGLGRGHFGFEDSASEALTQWEFEPGKVDGQPADVRMTLKIDFVLTDEYDALPMLSWRSEFEHEESFAHPRAMRQKQRGQMLATNSVVTVPVWIDLDERGNMTSFEVEPAYSANLDSFELMNSIEKELEYFRFAPAHIDGEATTSSIKVMVATPLKPQQ